MPPELRALASRLLADVPESMLSWTCLKEHSKSATVWRATGPAGQLVFKRHRHPRPFQQELRAYRDWLPAVAAHLSLGTSRSEEPKDREKELSPGPRSLAGAVRVPALLACDPAARVLALTAAPGERLSLGTHDPALAPVAHAAAGRFLRALHELPVADDDPMPLVDAVAARLAEWHARARGLLSPGERDGLQRLAARRDAFAGVRRVPCHRDFTPDNWLLAGADLHVLDFEHARLDAPEADLVKLRAEVWFDRPDLAEAFLAAHGPLTTDAAARLDVLLALHAAATLAWAERHADPAFHALGRRALAVALAHVS
ncbi:aminoglycoside phosphotransferase family protein [Nannocystis punicea]|uniref:Aminoglycoside phosphotransferase family protein n=1 Tax=Nannocystis punicea TaxID=2995304 RepID=A0ABY7H5C0_9BACT|nr:aminoglycoside phosphotransferase family protein [Nannocystis poenicansa]WAS94387.1 aminoglycoside phosphotransferase family protein [Nannocystis poenicansa]